MQAGRANKYLSGNNIDFFLIYFWSFLDLVKHNALSCFKERSLSERIYFKSISLFPALRSVPDLIAT